jgi:hypothetical protein
MLIAVLSFSFSCTNFHLHFSRFFTVYLHAFSFIRSIDAVVAQMVAPPLAGSQAEGRNERNAVVAQMVAPPLAGSQAEGRNERNAVVAQMVEHQLPKLRVVGSIPIYRSQKPDSFLSGFFYSLTGAQMVAPPLAGFQAEGRNERNAVVAEMAGRRACVPVVHSQAVPVIKKH